MSTKSLALTIEQLSVSFRGTGIVHDVALAIRRASVHCLVGDSGSGKTLTSLASVGLLPPGLSAAGTIHLANEQQNLLELDTTGWASLRGQKIGFIGQNALGCLHPAYTIQFQLIEAIRRHQNLSRSDARNLALDGLAAVDLDDPERVAMSRPAELSGGMCQRVALAIALCNRPSVLIADEPTTALDDETQAQVLELITSRTEQDGLSALLVTHDQDVVRRVADEVTTIAGGISQPGRPATTEATRTERISVEAATSSPPLLEISGVSMRFERRRRMKRDRATVLNNVSISAPEQSTVGLVGRSGAGKTTLARIVAGILAPSDGAVTIGGRPITGPDRVDRVERAGLVQHVFQDPFGSLNPRRSALTQVAEPLLVQGASNSEAESRAEIMLDSVGLSSAQSVRRPSALSGGQCQRVGLARALIRRPKVVVLDEPVSALDWSIRSEILAILADLQAELAVTYLLISHERPLVDDQCDEIYQLGDGALTRL